MTLESIVEMPSEQQQALGLIFTPREIAQQPDTWMATLEIFKKNREKICTFLENLGLQRSVEQRPVVILIGAGTSDYIGQALVLLLRQCWRCEVIAFPSTDLLLNMEQFLVPGLSYLWISFSRSGDSPEGVAVLERAIKSYPQIAHMIVTCNQDATMINVCRNHPRSCVIVLDPAVNDRSLAMTSSFTNMIILGQCLAHAWSIEEYEAVVRKLSIAAGELLRSASDLAEQLAFMDFRRLCFVGSGALASVAKESALKVLEMTAGRVLTISETILGLRHGPMAALNPKALFVCFVPGDVRGAMYARDLLHEIRTKKIAAKIVAVGALPQLREIEPVCDSYLPINIEVSDLYRPPLDVIFGQLLGLHYSIFNGLKPDTPSPAGVITRVVQKFGIY